MACGSALVGLSVWPHQAHLRPSRLESLQFRFRNGLRAEAKKMCIFKFYIHLYLAHRIYFQLFEPRA